jgi:SNF2 family DNA or RNA helicase
VEVVALFHPPFTLFPFQVDFAIRCATQPGTMLAADTGTGKSVCVVAAMCALLEDNRVDNVIIAAEKAKLYEWMDDLSLFTDVPHSLYSGTSAQREKIRRNLPTVIIGTFETLRNDFAFMQSDPKVKRVKTIKPGPLTTLLQDKSVLYIKDEGPAKMGASRTSQMYKFNAMFCNQVRKHGLLKVIDLSATPLDRDPEGFFNVMRLSVPEIAGTVQEFNRDHIVGLDYYGNPVGFKNLSPELTQIGKKSLQTKFSSVLLTKSKTDPDVVKFFPETIEDHSFVRMTPSLAEFYWKIVNTYSDPENDRALFTVMRQLVSHPCSLLTSQGGVTRDIVSKAPQGFLEALEPPKLPLLLHRLQNVVAGQQSQAVIFTFFGQTVLPLLYKRLTDEGYSVTLNHGQLSAEQRSINLKAFRHGYFQIFLTSDAGARGINIPNCAYVELWEAPLKHSTQVQRINRISRLSSQHSTIFAHTYIVRDSIEEPILEMMLQRKGYADETIKAEGLSLNHIRRMLNQKRGAD